MKVVFGLLLAGLRRDHLPARRAAHAGGALHTGSMSTTLGSCRILDAT